MHGKRSNHWKGGVSYDMKTYKINCREQTAGKKKPEQCELCGSIGVICFDHCHKTGKFRGWICRRCNLVLGMVKDNQELLVSMVDYLNVGGTVK